MLSTSDFSEVRDRLYGVAEDEEASVDERLRRILQVGQEYLGVESGHIQRRDGPETDRVVASVGNADLLPEGVDLDRETTYCRVTVTSTEPLALTDAPAEGWADDPAYAEHGLRCYLGTDLRVDGELYGTVCFASRAAREKQFSESELVFVELAARLLERVIESAEQQKRLEASERAKERVDRKYRTLVETAPDAVVVADADTGEIVETNERATELTGYSAAELTEMQVFDLCPAAERERYVGLFESGLDGTSRERFEDGTPLRVERADGDTVPVALSVNAVEFEDGRYLHGIFQDVTEQRERERALRRNRAFFERTQEVADLGGWEVDLRSDELRLTDELRRMLGFDPDEDPRVEAAFESIHPEDRPALEAAYERLVANGEGYDTEVRVRTDDGTTRWARAVGTAQHGPDGDPVVVRGVFQDVTERRERRSELRLKSRAIEEAPVGITIADVEGDQPLTYVNPAFERITGYDSGAAVGRNCRFLQGPDTDETAVASIREGIEAGESTTTELLNYRADGTPFWNELTVAPVTVASTDTVVDRPGEPGGDGADSASLDQRSVTHFVGLQRDVTDRKRRERLLDVLDRVLRHNLRNDLSVADGYGKLIAERADDETAAMAERLVDAVEDLLELSETARELQDLAYHAGSAHPRDVAADLRAVAEAVRAEHPDATVQVDAPAACHATATDRIRTALGELVENAVTHGGGEVDCEVERDDDAVLVRVCDDGPGLSAAEQRVLDEGRETPLTHSDGLGLWLVNWIVTGVGGSMSVTVDDGTTVLLRLPTDTGATRDAAISAFLE